MKTAPGLFEISMKAKQNGEGDLESGVKAQIKELESQGVIRAEHSGIVALAIRAAREADQSEGIGAPSGRAALLKTMNEILSSLPQPENTGGSSELDRVLEAIREPENG